MERGNSSAFVRALVFLLLGVSLGIGGLFVYYKGQVDVLLTYTGTLERRVQELHTKVYMLEKRYGANTTTTDTSDDADVVDDTEADTEE